MKWLLAIAIGLGAGLAQCHAGPLGIFGRGSCANGQCSVSVRTTAPAPVVATPVPVSVAPSCGTAVDVRQRVRVRQRLIFRGRLRGC